MENLEDLDLKQRGINPKEIKRLKEYRKTCLLSYTPGDWIQFAMKYTKFMPTMDALTLGFIINDQHKYCLHPEVYQEYDGWFYTTIKKIEENVGIPEKTQRRILNRLKEMKLIKTKRKGTPLKRYIQVDFKRLNQLLESLPQSEKK